MKNHQFPLTSVLVKPAGPDCNMSCDYCFYIGKSELFPGPIHRMSGDILNAMIKQVMSQGADQISFGWQGGEPTLMGLPFFQMAVDFQIRYGNGKSVGNGFQTNGILIDEKWGRFFRDYRFLVGLSIDGPEHVHDHHRHLHAGKKNWSFIRDKAKLLLDSGVEVNALSVVTNYSSGFAEETYEFHKDAGLMHMQFIPCVETDPADRTRPAAYSVSSEKYGIFLIKIFDLWMADIRDLRASTSIRFFDSVFHAYVGLPVPDCTLGERCGSYLVVEHNGDVFPCDFFVEPGWKLGNVMNGELKDMLNSDRQRKFGGLKAALPPDCSGCRWLILCHGGCTKDRLRDPSDIGKMHFCESYKMFFAHADEPLRNLAAAWLRQQRSGNNIPI